MGNKEKFVITKETVQNAKTYMPLDEKWNYAKVLSQTCLVEAGEQEKSMGLSPLWKEDNYLKAICVQNIFLSYYLGLELQEVATVEEFDRYAEGQYMNCLERFKNDPALKEKIFDMLYDFRELKKLIDVEIYQEKQVRNDSINRLLENMAKVSSPENFKAKGEELKSLLKEIEKSKEEKVGK